MLLSSNTSSEIKFNDIQSSHSNNVISVLAVGVLIDVPASVTPEFHYPACNFPFRVDISVQCNTNRTAKFSWRYAINEHRYIWYITKRISFSYSFQNIIKQKDAMFGYILDWTEFIV